MTPSKTTNAQIYGGLDDGKLIKVTVNPDGPTPIHYHNNKVHYLIGFTSNPSCLPRYSQKGNSHKLKTK